jgi:adenosylhomocysteine nucleosidase
VILVFTALAAETDACLGWSGSNRQRAGSTYPVFHAEGIAVCQTGMGRRANDAADTIIDRVAPSAVVSAGTAGGLHPDLPLGAVVLCEHLHHAEMRDGRIEPVPTRSDEALIAVALEAGRATGLHVRRGSSVTVDEPAWGPEEKSALHGWMKHDVTEMESYWIGKAAEAAGVPYLAVRVVSDTADHRLPEYPGLNPDGSMDVAVFQAHCRAHPELIPEYAAQAERGRLAITNLTTYMTTLLPHLAKTISGAR